MKKQKKRHIRPINKSDYYQYSSYPHCFSELSKNKTSKTEKQEKY